MNEPLSVERTQKTVKLDADTHALMKAEAATLGLPLCDLLETVLVEWLRTQGLPTKRRELRLIQETPKSEP